MDTVYFLPSRIEIPITNSFDQILQAAKNITTALKEHPHPRTPYLEFRDAKLKALKKLASIFEWTAAASKKNQT